MPALVKLYIRQVLIGFGLSAVFVGGLMWFNVANLWHLVTHTAAGPVALVMLFMFNGIVFAGGQFGIAVMRMADDGAGGAGGRRQGVPALRPAPALARAAESGKRRSLRMIARR